MAVGRTDISGNDFGDIFASAVQGTHFSKPLGIVDVENVATGWSVKTVKTQSNLDNIRHVRLISGRNSPTYSTQLDNVRDDPQATGEAVLAIWNARYRIAAEKYNDIRTVVLIRNMGTQTFRLFEVPTAPFPAVEYTWSYNSKNNLEGREKGTGQHCFTWQPHGSQFTVIRHIPASSRRFSIDRVVNAVSVEAILELSNYSDDWITIE
ncbi:MAG: hypothetical protein OXG08_08745 [Gammaproteobacteria bacterium]|nr:hypothetical protein [Gammaproteobacteria bacterium]